MITRRVAVTAAVVITAALAACSSENNVYRPQTPTTTVSPEPAPSGSVWVADEGGDSLTVLDASTNAVTTTVRGLKKPHNVQVGRDSATMHAVSSSSSSNNIVVAIDAATYTVEAAASTGPAPAHVIDAPSGRVYVTNTGDGTVWAYQTPGLQPVGRINLGGMPHGLRPAAGGSVIVVANTMAGALDLIDPAADTW